METVHRRNTITVSCPILYLHCLNENVLMKKNDNEMNERCSKEIKKFTNCAKNKYLKVAISENYRDCGTYTFRRM